MVDPDLHVASTAVHENTPVGRYVGTPGDEERYGQWSMHAFDRSEKPAVGKRSQEWTAVGQTELHCVLEMARCLAELKAGPKSIINADAWLPGVAAPFLPYERIERPSQGFAISIPSNGEYVDGTSSNAAAWWDPEKVDDVSEHHQAFLADGGMLIARQASPPGEHFCEVFDLTALAAEEPKWATLADVERDILWWYEADPGVIDAGGVYVNLPAGRTLAIDSVGHDGYHCREHFYTDGGTWFILSCYTHSAPADRWLSIAETFEFISVAGEGATRDGVACRLT